MNLYIWRNSGFRVWLASELVTAAGWLNPAKPWKRPLGPATSDVIDTLKQDARQAKIDRNQLAEQVREFRRLCDPMEKVVLCTAAEIHSFGFSDPSD